MLRKALLAIVVFVIVGEAMIRFDAATLFFQGGEHLSNAAKRSDVLEALNSGRFHSQQNQLRVMLVGDSYLYGAGVAPDRHFTVRLKDRLVEKCQAPCPEVSVLDLTSPGNNTWANVRDFLKYADAFQPQVALLAYNENDVYGRQEEAIKSTAAAKPRSDSADGGSLETVRSLRRALFSSKLAELLLTKTNMELKLAGVVVPGTEFEHQVNRSHSPDYPGWVRSQRLLADLGKYCRDRNVHLLVANMPELNMLGNYGLYSKADAAVEQFFRSINVDFVNAAEAFLRNPSRDFSISRYDGHPNEKAHSVVADFIAGRLTQAISVNTGSPRLMQRAALPGGVNAAPVQTSDRTVNSSPGN
ncbi:MAG: hypothetical protein SGI92_00655 [Bryobacteraceae bacterium]|nr:hypothetical protein [Bryobacteraceae bacterium]